MNRQREQEINSCTVQDRSLMCLERNGQKEIKRQTRMNESNQSESIIL